ncbi:MAG: hypothetical protein MUE34_12910 [Acidimicrobiales bacterium]|nr:hypothetical protein [Acidimicrobiales bacterium]
MFPGRTKVVVGVVVGAIALLGVVGAVLAGRGDDGGTPVTEVLSGSAESGSSTTAPPETVPPETAPPATAPPVTGPPATSPPTTDPEAALADPNLFVDQLPALRTAGAPDWVSEGTRITYYAVAASTPNSYHQYVEDEFGEWIDPATGERYTQEDIPGAAGHGYNQVTVASLTDAVAALSVRAFGLSDLSLDSPVVTLTWSGAIGIPGAGADYWLHPDVLATVEEVVSPSLKILRMPYTIDGREFSSLWIQSLGDDANLTWVYDLDSGILLHTASATTGPPIAGPVAAGEGREGNTFLTQSTLVDVRDLDLPWADGTAPSWVGTTSRLQYEGFSTVSVLGDPSVMLGSSLAVERRSSGTDWVRYRMARTTSSTVSPSVTEYLERVEGSAMVGALFLPVEELAGLVPGQVLDQDPVTGAVVSVVSVEPITGSFVVTIREEGPGEVSEVVYDGRSGVASTIVTENLLLGIRTELLLAGWS